LQATSTRQPSYEMRASTLLIVASVLLIAAGQPTPTTTHFPTSLRDLKYVNHKVIFAITADGKVQKSIDGGAHWTAVSLPTSGGSTVGSDLHVNGEAIIIHGTRNTNWWSIDGGQTFTEDKSSARMSHLTWHPLFPNSLLGYRADNHASYVTTNYGQSYSPAYSWSLEPSSWGDAGVGDVHNDRVYGVARVSGGDYTLDYTDDKGATYHTLQKNSFTAIYLPHQIFSLAYADGWNDIYLRVSPDIGRDVKNFYRAEFPWGEELETKNLYAILDDYTGAVFMAINHKNSDSRWGHLYVSDAMGVQYVMSLSYIVHSNTEFDFMRVLGMKGVYVANQLINHNQPNSPEQIKTLITYNNGAYWGPIAAPSLDSNKNPFPCSGANCRLHLHGWKTIISGAAVVFGPFYSAESALGLVIGNGNVGEFLSSDPNQVGTFLSNNGGITWKELAKGPTIYEIADHGGVVVWAEINRPTNKIWYTLNFGEELKSITLEKSINVWNIISETYLNGTSFLIIDNNYTTVMHIDFKSEFGRECTNTDYEEWMPRTPATVNNDGLVCLMGTQTKYSRRIPGRICHSPANFVETKIREQKACKCTQDDFECDYGYRPNGYVSGTGTLNCERVESIKLHDPPLWCKPGRKYNVTKGYRLEAGNGCQGGLDLHPVEKDCPSDPIEDKDEFVDTSKSSGSSHKAGWIAVGIMVPIVLLIIAGAFFALNNEKLREKLPYLGQFFNRDGSRDGYARPGGGAPALFDDEEYIIGPLDDRHDDDDGPDALKTVDLHSPQPQDMDEFDPRK